MTSIELLSMPKSQRILYRIGGFFKGIPTKFAKFFRKTPIFLRKIWKGIKSPFVTLYDALIYGDWKTRLSFLIMGFGQICRKEIAKGILLLLFEVAFIAFSTYMGINYVSQLGSLGEVGVAEKINPVFGTVVPIFNSPLDRSFNILLYSITTIIVILIFIGLWYSQIKRAKVLQDMSGVGKYTSNDQFIKDLSQRDYHKTLLAFPIFGLVTFTIIPILLMIVMVFTNYSSSHEILFDWIGLDNFAYIFGVAGNSNALIVTTFFKVLAWTLIWAFFATFTNYFLGMVVAILINTKGIKLKKLWRTVLVTTIAVPQFISLLLISKCFQDSGVINSVLLDWGWIEKPIRWLGDPLIAKIVIIVVNTWVGIPYTMLICTGLLMNIPDDLYESAKIDGASPFKMYMKITLPYMLFVTTPYLISQFVGNINNFNIIFLLTGGNPVFNYGSGAVPNILQGIGETDILITWIYKLTMANVEKQYALGGAISIIIFVIVATISLIFYNKSNSVKNEEDYQ